MAVGSSHRLRHHLAVERGERHLDRHGDLRRAGAGGGALQAVGGVLGAELAEAVLGLAAEGHPGVLGVDHRLHDAGVAALAGDAVERAVGGDGVGGHLLRRRVVPLAHDLGDFPGLAGGGEDLVDAVVAVGVDRGAGDAAHLEDLAAVGDVLDQPVAPELAQALLVDVDVDGVGGVEDVVEGDEDDARLLGALDDRAEGGRVLGVDDDGVVAGVDEVVDRRDLRRHVLAGGDDLELRELRGDVGLRGVGLGGLDHLDAPGVGDVAVGQRDPVGAFLLRELEELGVGGPGHHALRVGGRAGYDFGIGQRRAGRGGEDRGRYACAEEGAPESELQS